MALLLGLVQNDLAGRYLFKQIVSQKDWLTICLKTIQKAASCLILPTQGQNVMPVHYI